jgi:hypothetical protein
MGLKAVESLGLFEPVTALFKKTKQLVHELPQEPKRIFRRLTHGPEHALTESERSRFFDLAERARDDGIRSLPKKKERLAVIGGVNIRTGRTAFGRSSNPVGCAEDDVVRQLGGDPNEVLFSKATRRRLARLNSQIAICRHCQAKYRPSQFPPGTKFKGAFESGGSGVFDM